MKLGCAKPGDIRVEQRADPIRVSILLRFLMRTNPAPLRSACYCVPAMPARFTTLLQRTISESMKRC